MLNNELALEDQASYKHYLHMTKKNFDTLLNLVKPDIEKTEKIMQTTILARNRLQITLRYLATGESFRSLMFSTRLHESTISRFIPEVCPALYEHLKNDYLKTPTCEDSWKKVSEEFYNCWQFPNCVGALDGRHIKFKPPRSDGSYYYNYKGDHSIVLLALCDAHYRFTYVNVGCNGRISDGGVFRESRLSTALENNELNIPPPKALPGRTVPVPYVIITDDAFPDKCTIMKLYPQRGNERLYNYGLSRARRVIENSFGILANRFIVLLNPIPLRVEKVELITLTAVTLHNYLATNNTYLYIDDTVHNATKNLNRIGKQGGNKSICDARIVCEQFKEYFCSEIGKVPWQEEAVQMGNL